MKHFLALVCLLVAIPAHAGNGSVVVDISCPGAWQNHVSSPGWSTHYSVAAPNSHSGFNPFGAFPPMNGMLSCGPAQEGSLGKEIPKSHPICAPNGNAGFICLDELLLSSVNIICPTTVTATTKITDDPSGQWQSNTFSPTLTHVGQQSGVLLCYYGQGETPAALQPVPSATPDCYVRPDGNGYYCYESGKGFDLLAPKPSKSFVSVFFVRLADDDGSNGSPYTSMAAKMQVYEMNKRYDANGADIQFYVDPASDFVSHVKSDDMNRHCEPTALQLQKQTKKDLDGDGKDATDADEQLFCDSTVSNGMRAAYALTRPWSLSVFLRAHDKIPTYDDAQGMWVMGVPPYIAYSGGGAYGVVALGAVRGGVLAHEVGHYFHLPHTFTAQTTTATAAGGVIEAYVQKHKNDPGFSLANDALKAFDGDLSRVSDTPPDASAKLFSSVYGDACGDGNDAIVVPALIDGVWHYFVNAPDRSNIMSYFNCGKPTFSPGQVARMQSAIAGVNLPDKTLSRQPLVRPELKECYLLSGLLKTMPELGFTAWSQLIDYRQQIVDQCLQSAQPAPPRELRRYLRFPSMENECR